MKTYPLLLLLFLSSEAVAQPTQTGFIPTPADEYEKIPIYKANSTATTARVANISRTATTRTTLAAPPFICQDEDGYYQGSCAGWSIGYMAMSILTYSKYCNWDAARRSPSYIYNQLKVGDCSSGASFSEALKLVKNQGCCSWNLMPYSKYDCTTQPDQGQRDDAANNKATEFGRLQSLTDCDAIKDIIDDGYPVLLGVNHILGVNPNDKRKDPESDLLNPKSYMVVGNPTPNSTATHASCIIGYDNINSYFKVYIGLKYFEGIVWLPYNMVEQGFIKEGYVLYGSNRGLQTYPNPAIEISSSLVCTSSNFSVINLPIGQTVSWLSSNASGLSIDNSGVATRNNNFNGEVIITANISTACGTIPLTKTVSVGAPAVAIYTSMIDCYKGHMFYKVEAVGEGSNWSWFSIGGGLEFIRSRDDKTTAVELIGRIYPIFLSYTNACGESVLPVYKELVNTCPPEANAQMRSQVAETTAFPNPSTTELTVEVSKEVDKLDEKAAILLVDQQGKIYYNTSTDNPTVSLSVEDLPRGLYFLHISYRGKIEKKQIILK